VDKSNRPPDAPWFVGFGAFLIALSLHVFVSNQLRGQAELLSASIFSALAIMLSSAMLAGRCHWRHPRRTMVSVLLFAFVGASLFVVDSPVLWWVWVGLGAFAGTSFVLMLQAIGDCMQSDDPNAVPMDDALGIADDSGRTLDESSSPDRAN